MTQIISPNIDRKHGSEATKPCLLVAADRYGYETIYLGPLNTRAILRTWRGGYRVLVKTKNNTWVPGSGVDDSHVIPLKGRIPELVLTLTGEEVSKDGEELLSLLPESGAMCHSCIVRNDESRLLPLPYVGPELQELRNHNAFRGY
ncbi:MULTISPECIES: hypothetical protein [Hyphomonas]|uniref:hypothetical protein n=1 Tax=Hyphomonas TaxID=85 RepID=UPI003515546C